MWPQLTLDALQQYSDMFAALNTASTACLMIICFAILIISSACIVGTIKASAKFF